jgi:hypothetical protein
VIAHGSDNDGWSDDESIARGQTTGGGQTTVGENNNRSGIVC